MIADESEFEIVGSKRSTVAVLVRLPPDVKRWLEREAARNAGSRNSEIVRSIRKRMDSEKQPERAAG